jgi:hypothetical protein
MINIKDLDQKDIFLFDRVRLRAFERKIPHNGIGRVIYYKRTYQFSVSGRRKAVDFSCEKLLYQELDRFQSMNTGTKHF